MSRPHYIPTLDGWRAVAILMVLSEHALPLLASLGATAGGPVARLLKRGSLGVDIFFTLSGYLIGTLLLREKNRTGRIAVGGFLLRRGFRIVPALWVYLAVVLAGAAVGILPAFGRAEQVASFFFARNYVPGTWYTGHTWSLALEIHFYLLAPLILATLSWRSATWVTALLSLAVIVGRVVEVKTGWMQHLLPETLATFRTENRLDELLNGLLLALILGHAGAQARLTRWLTTGTTLALLVVGSLALARLGGEGIVRVGLIVPIAVAHTLLHPTALAGRMLEWAPLRWLGLVSYSLYLWQQLFLPEPHQMAVGRLALVQQSVWSLPLALLIATLSLKGIEQPMTRLGRRQTRPEPPVLSLDQRAEGREAPLAQQGSAPGRV